MEGGPRLGTPNRGGRLMRRDFASGGCVKVARYRETLRTNRPVSRGHFFIVAGGFATIPHPPLGYGRRTAFLRQCGIYRSDVAFTLGRGTASRWSGPGQGKEHAGRNMPCPSVAMSSDRLFLDRGARQHCPSPLHRQAKTTMHFPTTQAEGDIPTLPVGGHFYFALTANKLTLRWSVNLERQGALSCHFIPQEVY